MRILPYFFEIRTDSDYSQMFTREFSTHRQFTFQSIDDRITLYNCPNLH